VFAATPLRDRLDLGIVVLYAQAAIRFRLRPRGAGAFAANRLVAEAQNDCGKKMDTHRTKHEIMIERQRRILTVLMNLGREIRWLVSRDARVRGKGRTTVGWIIGMASKHHPSDSRSWDTYFTPASCWSPVVGSSVLAAAVPSVPRFMLKASA